MKAAVILPMIALLASCRAPVDVDRTHSNLCGNARGVDVQNLQPTTTQPITRNNIDAVLNHPNRSDNFNEISGIPSRLLINRGPYSSPDAATLRACRIEAKADMVASYAPGSRTLSVNRPEGTKEIRGQLPALISWFDKLEPKKLAVVIIEKSVLSDSEIQGEVARLDSYLHERGYPRVVIQQARAISRPTYSDTTDPRPRINRHSYP